MRPADQLQLASCSYTGREMPADSKTNSQELQGIPRDHYGLPRITKDYFELVGIAKNYILQIPTDYYGLLRTTKS